tara:strand:- start:442 stop:651 length:210 start_codon:yes stop_codon:yes gene_type:complete
MMEFLEFLSIVLFFGTVTTGLWFIFSNFVLGISSLVRITRAEKERERRKNFISVAELRSWLPGEGYEPW